MNPAASPDERWASDVVLGDGETVHIRPIRPSDRPALAAFHRRQSPQSIYRRYFSPKPELSAPVLDHFTNVDMVGRVALVVERYGELIAWASYERWAGRDDADAAFMVDDEHQGKGIATLLLEHLAAIARSNGINRFTAEVLADNRPMLAVFSRAGWPVERRFESGVVDLDFPLDDTEEFLDSVERREQRADSRAMARFLLPRTIAVVGASEQPGSMGELLWRNVARSATGAVFPVNPAHETIGGRHAWPSLRDIPADVSLAVIAVPADQLVAVIEDCIASHVRGAVVLTSVDGTDIDVDALVVRARRAGVRLIGPGSAGVAASRPSIGLQASLLPVRLPPGNVAMSLQSGTIGASVLRLADQLDMGLSWFVSLGDKSDVSGNDLLQFWEDDETTRVIAMYTESIGNPRKFARIARRVSRTRPIVTVHAGAARDRLNRERALPAGRRDRGADGGRHARHGAGPVDAARDARPAGRRDLQRPQPGDARPGGVDHRRAGARRLAGTAHVELDTRRLRRRRSRRARRRRRRRPAHRPRTTAPRRTRADRRDRGGRRRGDQADRHRADRRLLRSGAAGVGAAGVRLPRASRRRARALLPVRALAGHRGRGRGRRGGRHRPRRRGRDDRRRVGSRRIDARCRGCRQRAAGLWRARSGDTAGPGVRRRDDGRRHRLPGRREGRAPPPRPVGQGGRRPRPARARRRHRPR